MLSLCVITDVLVFVLMVLFHSLVAKKTNHPWDSRQQEDASEFLLALLSVLNLN